MVLTSLSVGVSASHTTPTEDANYHTLTFDKTETKGYAEGEFYLSNKKDKVKLGTTQDDVPRIGMNFKKFEFKAGTLKGAYPSTISIRGEVNYKAGKYNFSYSQGHCGSEYFLVSALNKVVGAKDLNKDGTIDEDTEKGTGNVVKVPSSFYNNPASVWSAGESNLTLVAKSDGTVYNAGDTVPGTLANYCMAINGVYANVEPAPILYDIVNKTATVNVNMLPEGTTSMQIVVAAYDANGSMEKIKVSESYTNLTSDITYVIDDATFPTDADSYKVFVFDSLISAKPLVEALEK